MRYYKTIRHIWGGVTKLLPTYHSNYNFGGMPPPPNDYKKDHLRNKQYAKFYSFSLTT